MTTVAIPDNADDFAAVLTDPAKLKAAAEAHGGGPDGIKAFTKAYSAKLHAFNADAFKSQIETQAQLALAELLNKQANGGTGVPKFEGKSGPAKGMHYDPAQQKVVNTAASANNVYNPDAPGAPLNGAFNSLAEFMQFAWQASHPSAEMARRSKSFQDKMNAYEAAIKNYQEKVPSEGGFLVPEEYRAGLLSLSLGSAIVRPRATVVPMSSATLTLPMVDETSRVSHVFGGVAVYRTEEGAELTESAATFAALKLIASKQTALAHVTNELVRDTNGFGAYIEQTFPPAMAYAEDLDYIGGNGAGEPLGALHPNNTALLEVAKETGQPAATIVWENVLRMYARFMGNIDRAVWIVTPDAFVELATMALSVGTGGSAVWITDATGRPRLTLLGIPVIMSEKAPAVLGTKGDISLVDFGFYVIGDRQRIEVDASPHVKFTSDKTTFRAIARNDGQPWIKSPLTPQNNGPTMSPFVTLATRA